MTQEIHYRELSPDERLALEAALAFASRIAKEQQPLSLDTLQRLYDSFRAEKIKDRDAIIAVGMAFGAAIIDQTGFDWVRITDEFGEETCVGPKNRSLHCAPISIISKRLSRDESVDLAELCEGVIQTMRSQLAEGNVGDW